PSTSIRDRPARTRSSTTLRRRPRSTTRPTSYSAHCSPASNDVAGVILYGPPASGKDTISHALESLNDTYRTFERLKAGGGRTDGYRLVTDAEMDTLSERGELIWENSRYAARYAIDRESLGAALHHLVPIVHLGQPAGVEAVRTAFPEST